MADIYKIAIGLSMTSNHAQVLSALSAGLLHAHVNAEKLQGSLSRIKLAVGGGLAIAGGVAILGGLKTMVDHAKELNHQLATLRTQGLNQAQVAMAQATARQTTTQVPGSTESGNVKLIGEAYSLFGLPDAMRINKQMAQYAQVIGSATGDFHKAEEGLYAMIRSGDLMGKLVNEHTHKADPDKLLAYFDIAAKMAAVTHGKVNAQTFLAVAQQGGPALANMSDDGMIAMMMAAQGMGGARAGTAMTSLYQQMIGGTMTESKARELRRLGVIGDYDVGRGGHLNFKPGALDTDFAKALGTDPLTASKLLTEAMQAHGIEGTEAQTKELFNIIGRQTSQRLLSDFIRNLPQMIAERGRIEGGQGLEAQARTRNETDLTTAEHNMSAAWKNLMEAVAGPNAIAAIGVMNQITASLNSLTTTVRGMNPETIVNIAKGIGVLGVTLTGAGALAILAALGPAGWLIGGIGAFVAGVVAFKPQIEGVVASVAPLAAKLEEFKTKTYAAIADFAPKLIAEVLSWPSRLGTAIAEMGAGLVTAIGDMLKSLFSKLNPFSKTAFEGGGFDGSMIHNASFVTGGGANDNFGGSSGVARALGQGGFGGKALPVGSGSGVGHIASQAERAAYIRQSAIAHGIDPNVALRVAQSEGFGKYVGDFGTSFGDFQLHFGGSGIRGMNSGGLGDVLARRGINARDPRTWKQQTDFAMEQAAKGGWGPWHGAKRVGIGNHQGIGVHPPKEAPAAGPPPKPAAKQPIMVELTMDGKKMGRAIAMHQADDHLFPRKAGGMDTHGSFRSPGTPVTDAA